MEIKEAIIRIKDHIRVHKIGQPPHILIGEALALALNALQKEDKKRAVVISDKLICCPRCRSGEYTTNEQGKKNEYCGLCGQHLEHKENGEICKPTQLDRIKAMNAEELAEYICGIQEAPCHCCNYRKDGISTEKCGGGYDTDICRQGVIQMLESEATE